MQIKNSSRWRSLNIKHILSFCLINLVPGELFPSLKLQFLKAGEVGKINVEILHSLDILAIPSGLGKEIFCRLKLFNYLTLKVCNEIT